MLSITDYNYIKLLYDKFLKTNKYIADLIKKNEWESVEYAIEDKNILIKQIMNFEKVHLTDIKENDELLKIRMELIELEKDNIELVKTMKEETSKELNKTIKAKKMLNTYEPGSTATVSTFAFLDADD